jgi:colanic acid biosynthesis glycosyl transferase WcaI
MKILLLNQTFYPDSLATSQQVTDLALYLTSKGHRVSVVAGRLGYEDKEKKYNKHEWYRGVEIFRVGSLGLGKKSFLHRVFEALSFDICLLWKLLFLPAHDIVVSFTSPPLVGLFGMFFTLFKGGKSVQWLMDVNPDAAIAVGYIDKDSLVGKFLNWVFELTLKYADQVIVLDRWMQARIEAHKVPPEKIEIVPPWPVVSLQEAKEFDSEGVRAFRKQHGLEGKTVILYSGNHSIVHPLDTLLGSALEMKEDTNTVFLFMGAGLRTQDVTRFKEKHALTNIMQLPLQPRETFQDSLSSANIHIVVLGEAVSGLVHTSKIYGVLATGRPYVVIAPEKSHLNDLLSQCPYGRRVDHGNISGLATTLRGLSKLTADEREVIRLENTRFVSERYDAKHSLSFFEQGLTPFANEIPVP